MKVLMNLMSKAREMQAKMQEMQSEMDALELEGQSGGGVVRIVLTGKSAVRSVKIDPSLMAEDDVEVLEDLIMAAFNDAKAKVEAEMTNRTAKLTEGMPMPPGFKMPFG